MAAITAITTGANFAFELANCEDEFQPLTLVLSATYLFSALLLSPDLDLARSDPHNLWGYPRLLDPLRHTLLPPRALAQPPCRPLEPLTLPRRMSRINRSRNALHICG